MKTQIVRIVLGTTLGIAFMLSAGHATFGDDKADCQKRLDADRARIDHDAMRHGEHSSQVDEERRPYGQRPQLVPRSSRRIGITTASTSAFTSRSNAEPSGAATAGPASGVLFTLILFYARIMSEGVGPREGLCALRTPPNADRQGTG